jgi:hypothetical protein
MVGSGVTFWVAAEFCMISGSIILDTEASKVLADIRNANNFLL